MTEDEFAKLALSLPEAEANSHHGQPDFRVRGKIFATTGYTDGPAVLKLTPEQQEMLMGAEPDIFSRPDHSWGLKGWTHFDVAAADAATARSGLVTAWRNVAPKTLAKQHPDL